MCETEADSPDKTVTLRLKLDRELLPKYEIVVGLSMGLSIFVYDWPFPEDHTLYKKIGRSMFNITIRNLIEILGQYKICEGVQRSVNGAREHFIQYEREKSVEQRGFQGKKYFRPDSCELLCDGSVCSNCLSFISKEIEKEKKIEELKTKPLHPNTP